MKQSSLFTKTIKENLKDEESINAQLLIRAGFIDKLMAGVYSYLPLGFLVLKKIENIVREEMINISGQEVFLPALHPKENWEITNRWQQEENIMFKFKNQRGKDMGLGWTHEEIITPLVKKFVHSYKDLPVYVFQIQNKFRNELRAKSGLLRGREFIMKDLYSFHKDEKDLDNYHEKAKKAYFKVFDRCGIKKQTFLTYASGGAFSKYSYEFQTITPYGEDEIYLCEKCRLAINKEIIKESNYQCIQCKNKDLKIKKAIEVGNIFKLKDRFSKPFDLKFKDKNGEEKIIMMGCYGIGISRLMGAVVEVYHDDKGIIWPKNISPYLLHLIRIEKDKEIINKTDKIYNDLQKEKIEVLYDDREDKTAGEKFSDADLIGIPYRVLLTKKTLEKECVEIKKRNEKKSKLIKIKDVIKFVKEISK